ncbi:hypothetical protein H4582DRAFT_1140935 [Lactarius indigo]|nr:hypothetical protein H4582DRAFT_1140935 [Lactarius indigo]
MEMKYDVKSARGWRATAVASISAEVTKVGGASTPATKATGNLAQPKAAADKSDKNVLSTPRAAPAPQTEPVKPMTCVTAPGVRAAKDDDARVSLRHGRPAVPAPAKAETEDVPPAAAHVPCTLFGLGVAAAATPSTPALSSSIATPVLSSTAPPRPPTRCSGPRLRALAYAPTSHCDISISSAAATPIPAAPPSCCCGLARAARECRGS